MVIDSYSVTIDNNPQDHQIHLNRPKSYLVRQLPKSSHNSVTSHFWLSQRALWLQDCFSSRGSAHRDTGSRTGTKLVGKTILRIIALEKPLRKAN
jgi:hypothetical protein